MIPCGHEKRRRARLIARYREMAGAMPTWRSGRPRYSFSRAFRKANRKIWTLDAIVVRQTPHEGLHEEFRRRIKTQIVQPPERVEGGGNRRDGVLGFAGVRANNHPQDRRLAKPRRRPLIRSLISPDDRVTSSFEDRVKTNSYHFLDSTLKRSSKTLAGRPPEFKLRYSPGFPPLERKPRIS
jgi:hypothetical protein